jgi:hypothetical protein
MHYDGVPPLLLHARMHLNWLALPFDKTGMFTQASTHNDRKRQTKLHHEAHVSKAAKLPQAC